MDADDRYVHLETALARDPHRWSAPAVAAGRAIENAGHLTARQWSAIMDRIENALADALPSDDCPSSTRLRSET